MKIKIQLSVFLMLLSCLCFCQAPAIQWQKSYGGIDDDQARAIQQTKDSGYIVAGFSNSNSGQVTGHHGGSYYDYWVVKINGTGTIQWQKSLGGSNFDIANAVQQTTDGGYIVAGASASNDGDVSGGHGRDDYWVVKLNVKGNIQWQKTFGGSGNDVAQSVEQTKDGGYIVAGSSYSSNGDVTGHHGNQDYWVVKLDANGNLIWQKSLGGTDRDVATSAQQTMDGGYIVTGFTSSVDGDVTNNHGSDDYWIVKLDATGKKVWQKTYGGSAADDAYSIKQSADGGYFIAGNSISNNGDVSGIHDLVYGDYWVIKTDAAGKLLWQKTVGGTDYDIAFNLALTKDGGCVVAGTSRSVNGDINHPHGNYDYWVVKFTGTGTIGWQLSLGGSDYDEAYGIQEVASGYIVAGFSFSKNGNVTGNHGNNDFWVVKLKNTVTPTTVTINQNQSSLLNSYALSVTPVESNLIKVDLKLSDQVSQPAILELINLQGQIILKSNITINNGVFHQQLQPIQKLSKGIYFINIVGGDRNYNARFYINTL